VDLVHAGTKYSADGGDPKKITVRRSHVLGTTASRSTEGNFMKWLKRIAIGVGIFVALLGVAAAAMELRSPKARAIDAAKTLATPERTARGRYIVEAEAHCLLCHSEHDWKTHGAPILPGLKGAGWDVPSAENHMPGRVFAPNLTPDPETGLGAVPDDAIARAIREGVGHDGRALFMMPWPAFRNFSDEEVASVVAYLRSLPPVKKKRDLTEIQIPARWFMKGMPKPLETPVAEADVSDPVKRGKHLVEIGLCQDCHTPVNERHEPLPGMAFAGGQEFVIDGTKYRSANITPHPSGLAHYDEALFIRTMRTGNIGGRRLAPIMPWREVGNLTDEDLKAVWAFLKTIPPIAHDVERAPVALKDNPEINEHPEAAAPARSAPATGSVAAPAGG
jgi:mono/diheme cytochrome c family protein